MQKSKKKRASYLIEGYICDYFKNVVSHCKASEKSSTFVKEILQIIFSNPIQYASKGLPILIQELLSCLIEISTWFPNYLTHIQDNLLEIMSLSLFDVEFPKLTMGYLTSLHINDIRFKDSNQEIVASLRALYNFEFHNHPFLDLFFFGISLHFLKHDSKSIRKEAIICLCRAMGTSIHLTASASDLMHLSCHVSHSEIIGRILNVGILDPTEEIRGCVYTSLNTEPLIKVLSYPHYADMVLFGLNDESFGVQHTCVNLLHRISKQNPMIILKSLHKNINMLLNTLTTSSSNTTLKHDSTYMIKQFLKYFYEHMKPYSMQLFEILYASLNESEEIPFSSYRSCLLDTIGELFLASENPTCFNVNMLWSLLIGLLQGMTDNSLLTSLSKYSTKKTIATDKFLLSGADTTKQSLISCLINISRSSACHIRNHVSFSELRETLLFILRFDLNRKTRILAISYLGYIGPLDYEVTSDVTAGVAVAVHKQKGVIRFPPLQKQYCSNASIGDQFAYEICTILLKILSDPLLWHHHTATLQTIVCLVISLKEAAVSLYASILSVLMGLFSSTSSAFLESLCHHLITLLSVAQYNFRPYLAQLVENLFKLLELNELSLSSTIFSLFHSLVVIFQSEMFSYIQRFLKVLLRYFENPAQFIIDYSLAGHGSTNLKNAAARVSYGNVENGNSHGLEIVDSGSMPMKIDMLLKALEILPILGRAIEGYLHLFLGPISSMIENPILDFFYRWKALDCITLLCIKVKTTEHFSRIITPLLRAIHALSTELKPSEILFKEALLESIFIIISVAGVPVDCICTSILQTISSCSTFIRERDSLDQAYVNLLHSFETGFSYTGIFGPSSHIHQIVLKRFSQETFSNTIPLPQVMLPLKSLVAPSETITLNYTALRKVWDTSLRCSKEDWLDWIKNIALELLIQSPSALLKKLHQFSHHISQIFKGSIYIFFLFLLESSTARPSRGYFGIFCESRMFSSGSRRSVLVIF